MQREMYEPPGLQVKPKDGSREPRLWFRRLAIWSEPGATPIQDIAFGPGLNIVWSPDPADRSAQEAEADAPSRTGHGAGKTLLCRLLRYCLGEPRFAPDVLRAKISTAFKDGRVGAELLVDGVPWVVVRSIGVVTHDVVIEGGTLEAAVSPDRVATGVSDFVEMLAQRFLSPDVAGMITESPGRAWLLAIAWLTRDQECHFGRATEWRAAASDSGSPARRLSVGDATNVVRALIGALTPRERRLEEEIAELQKQRDRDAGAIEQRRWLIEQSVRRISKALGLERQTLPDGALLVGFLRAAARKELAQVSVVNATGELASGAQLEAEYEAARGAVHRIERDVSRAETAHSTAEAVAKLIASETPGLTASMDDAAMPTCPICEVPIDRALAEGCGLSHRLPDFPSLKQRREKNERELREKQAEIQRAEDQITRLRPELDAAKSKRDKAWKALRAARRLRDRRSEAWYAARRVVDDIKELQGALAENDLAEATLSRTDATLDQKRADVGSERAAQEEIFARLEQLFDPLVRRLLGDDDARGRVRHDGNGLHLAVEYGGERSTPAIDLVKVLAFDLATLCRSIEGGTKLPALLIHDSPRTSDLGLSIYHGLFHLVHELENVGSGPQFQYIVTTTSRPPDELAADARVRLRLSGAPADARLLRRDL